MRKLTMSMGWHYPGAMAIESAKSTFTIRPFQASDWPAVWAVLAPTFARADTYSYPPDMTEAAARTAWVEVPVATFIACEVDGTAGDGTVLGTYFIKPNQPGQGAHVCNCGYVVADAARGRGIAGAMCEHSQDEARRRGFRAMQFNFVVSTNEGAIRLWRRLGFGIVGTLPEAFCHPIQGFVDAYVMFKRLMND